MPSSTKPKRPAAKRPKPRNPVAKALRAAPFRQRVVKDKKQKAAQKTPRWRVIDDSEG